jgi:hypothetical protein
VYFAQRAIRRQESQALMEAEDRAARAYYARLRELHAAGKCGGAKLGCRYVPCFRREVSR